MLFDDTNYRSEKHTSDSWDIFGADEAVETLRTHIAKGLTNRSYMFIGPEGVGKNTLARRFAQAIFAPRNDDPTLPNMDSAVANAIERGEFGDVKLFGATEGLKTKRTSVDAKTD